MAGARGDALEWALALARAPGERLVLRQRPLPEGMDALLQIAAGHGGEVLADAVARTGETEASLVEAVRFYLREVLFHSGADAYRILGLTRGASAEEAKAHHRWLQQWLHPDRHTSDWDAIFAGRVNAAWNQLRTEDRRQAYDLEHPAERVAAAASPGAAPAMAAWARESLPVQTAWQRWQGRAPLLALMLACAGLGLLALRDVARDEALLVAGWPDGVQPLTGERQVDNTTLNPFGNLRLPEGSGPAVARARAAPPRAARQLPSVTRPPLAKRADAPRQSMPTPAAAPPVTLQTPRTPSPPLEMPAQAAGRSAIPNVSSTLPPAAQKPTTTPEVAATSAGTVLTRTASVAPVTPHPAPAPAKMPLQAQTEPLPTPAAATSPVATAAPRKLPAPEPSAPAAAPVGAERVRMAQQVGGRLVAFMEGPGSSIPPIWDSLSAQQGAAQLREGLLANGNPNFAQADWRVGERDAQMQVAIRYADGRTGRLDAGLVWREQRWLVSRLSMERDW